MGNALSVDCGNWLNPSIVKQSWAHAKSEAWFNKNYDLRIKSQSLTGEKAKQCIDTTKEKELWLHQVGFEI